MSLGTYYDNEFDILLSDPESLDVNTVKKDLTDVLDNPDEAGQRYVKHVQNILGKINDPKLKKLTEYADTVSRKIRAQEFSSGRKEVSFAEIQSSLTEDQMVVFGQTIGFVQMTKGCSIGCPSCGLNALHKVRSIMSFDCISEIVDRFGSYLKDNDALMYHASDPLDWEDSEGRTYRDIQALFTQKCDWNPYVSSAMPRGKEKVFRQVWRESQGIVRLSLSNVNRERIKRFIQNELQEDFQENMGLEWNIMHWLGDPKQKEKSFLLLHDGDNAQHRYKWEDYKKNKKYDVTTPNFVMPIGGEYDYASLERGIACKDGGKIMPDGVYTMSASMVTPRTPDGELFHKITPETFKIIPYAERTESLGIEPIEMIDLNSGEYQEPVIEDIKMYQFFFWILQEIGMGDNHIGKYEVHLKLLSNNGERPISEEEVPWILQQVKKFMEQRVEIRSEIFKYADIESDEDKKEIEENLARGILTMSGGVEQLQKIIYWAGVLLAFPNNEVLEEIFKRAEFSHNDKLQFMLHRRRTEKKKNTSLDCDPLQA